MVDVPDAQPTPASGEPAAKAGASCGNDCWASLLFLGRAARLGLRSRMFMPAAAGVLLTFVGWWGIATLFSGSDDPLLRSVLPRYTGCPLNASCMVHSPSDQELLAQDAMREAAANFERATGQSIPLSFPSRGIESLNVPIVWETLSRPVRTAFRADVTYQSLAFSLLAMLWCTAVWGLFGGAICRMAALELGREEKISWGQAFRHAAGRWRSLFAAPLFPLVGVLMFAAPIALMGLLGRTNVGLLISGVIWPLFLLASFLLALFVTGLWFGWPLMIAAISTESSDSFDGLSRAFSYVFQRSVGLLGYVITAVVFNALAIAVALFFSELIIYLTTWSFSWGSGAGPGEYNGAGIWGQRITSFWNSLVRLLATGAVYATFWSSAVAIYFLLRRDVDGTELDDVYTDEVVNTYGLPPLRKNSRGQVAVVEPTEAPAPEVSDG